MKCFKSPNINQVLIYICVYIIIIIFFFALLHSVCILFPLPGIEPGHCSQSAKF